MLSSYLATGAHPHDVTLSIAGLGPGVHRVEVRRIDSQHAAADPPAEAFVVTGPAATIGVELPADAVAFLELVPV
jgi:hypothetical protein